MTELKIINMRTLRDKVKTNLNPLLLGWPEFSPINTLYDEMLHMKEKIHAQIQIDVDKQGITQK